MPAEPSLAIQRVLDRTGLWVCGCTAAEAARRQVQGLAPDSMACAAPELMWQAHQGSGDATTPVSTTSTFAHPYPPPPVSSAPVTTAGSSLDRLSGCASTGCHTPARVTMRGCMLAIQAMMQASLVAAANLMHNMHAVTCEGCRSRGSGSLPLNCPWSQLAVRPNIVPAFIGTVQFSSVQFSFTPVCGQV
jgi:hypothetical protein